MFHFFVFRKNWEDKLRDNFCCPIYQVFIRRLMSAKDGLLTDCSCQHSIINEYTADGQASGHDKSCLDLTRFMTS